MAKKDASKSVAAIQKLLAERVQIERWLERLGLAGDKTPEAVRDKVRADYQTRLKELARELSEFGDELNEALKRQLDVREDLAKKEKEAAERMSEAEVRHAVGEYDEAKWREIHAEHLGSLVRIREELKTADDELSRLEDAVKSLQAPKTPVPATGASGPVSGAHPAVGAPRKSGQIAKPMDELAFLKSVTDDDHQGLKASRASGQQQVPEPIRPPAASDKEKYRTPLPQKPKVDVGAAGVAPIDTAGPGKRLTAALEKSLKCKECGTMNLPTEWYCEKCGAELSESL